MTRDHVFDMIDRMVNEYWIPREHRILVRLEREMPDNLEAYREKSLAYLRACIAHMAERQEYSLSREEAASLDPLNHIGRISLVTRNLMRVCGEDRLEFQHRILYQFFMADYLANARLTFQDRYAWIERQGLPDLPGLYAKALHRNESVRNDLVLSIDSPRMTEEESFLSAIVGRPDLVLSDAAPLTARSILDYVLAVESIELGGIRLDADDAFDLARDGILDLSGRGLDTLDLIPRFGNIAELDLENNRIAQIPALPELQDLRVLNLVGNPVREFRSLAAFHLERLSVTLPLDDSMVWDQYEDAKALVQEALDELTVLGVQDSLRIEYNPNCSKPGEGKATQVIANPATRLVLRKWMSGTRIFSYKWIESPPAPNSIINAQEISIVSSEKSPTIRKFEILDVRSDFLDPLFRKFENRPFEEIYNTTYWGLDTHFVECYLLASASFPDARHSIRSLWNEIQIATFRMIRLFFCSAPQTDIRFDLQISYSQSYAGAFSIMCHEKPTGLDFDLTLPVLCIILAFRYSVDSLHALHHENRCEKELAIFYEKRLTCLAARPILEKAMQLLIDWGYHEYEPLLDIFDGFRREANDTETNESLLHGIIEKMMPPNPKGQQLPRLLEWWTEFYLNHNENDHLNAFKYSAYVPVEALTFVSVDEPGWIDVS